MTKRDHYRTLGARLGDMYYQRATDLEIAEAGGYGKVSPRILARYKSKVAKAAAALDRAHAALKEADALAKELVP